MIRAPSGTSPVLYSQHFQSSSVSHGKGSESISRSTNNPYASSMSSSGSKDRILDYKMKSNYKMDSDSNSGSSILGQHDNSKKIPGKPHRLDKDSIQLSEAMNFF